MKKTYFLHESSYVDDNVNIRVGTKNWHFSHVQSGAVIGDSGFGLVTENNVQYRTKLLWHRSSCQSRKR